MGFKPTQVEVWRTRAKKLRAEAVKVGEAHRQEKMLAEAAQVTEGAFRLVIGSSEWLAECTTKSAPESYARAQAGNELRQPFHSRAL